VRAFRRLLTTVVFVNGNDGQKSAVVPCNELPALLTCTGLFRSPTMADSQSNFDVEKLEGWKAIADFLDVSERTARGWQSDGLPVHRFSGKEKSRVWALPTELRDWMLSRDVASEPHGPPFGPIPSNPAAIAVITSRRFWLVGTTLVLLAAAAASSLLHHERLADFRIQNRYVIGLDQKDRELWRFQFPWELNDQVYIPRQRHLFYWLGDLDGYGSPSLIFGARPVSDRDFGCFVYCFRADGSVKWTFETGRSIDDRGGAHMTRPYLVNGVAVMKGSNAEDTRVIITSAHHLDQPFQVAFLNSDGVIVGEYWHPGHLLHVDQADLDGDGRPELLLAGVNNGDHQATLVVLDPLSIKGSVTPSKMTDEKFALSNMAEASEKAVVFFPRSIISKGQPYTRASTLSASEGKIRVAVAESAAEESPGFIYQFDYNLNVLSVEPDAPWALDRFKQVTGASAEAAPLALEAECARLKANVVVRRQKR
jgi:hypothetical protein